jgi:excisionase family DNA binding protein
MNPDEKMICQTGMSSSAEPFVQLIRGTLILSQMTPDEARLLAHEVSRAADAADWLNSKPGKRAKQPQEPLKKATLTVLESMKVTGFGSRATYQLLHSGEMPHIKVGKIFYIPKYALTKWLETYQALTKEK